MAINEVTARKARPYEQRGLCNLDKLDAKGFCCIFMMNVLAVKE
jgi:hypothetical protein